MLIHTDNDINYNYETEERPKKNRKEIACCSWTTASGQIIPIFFKMQDEEGLIRTFSKIHVNHSSKKLYAGIPSYEFDCNVLVNGLVVNVLLQYYPEDSRWTLSELP